MSYNSGLNLAAHSINAISTMPVTPIDWGSFGQETQNTNVKKYEVYEISKDLLALSVCWARLRKEKAQSYNILSPTITKLLDSELFRLTTQEDIEQANIIRDYYSKKIMVWKLKNINLSVFRQDLSSFIHSNGQTFKESMIPLAYRLPEFYEYDVEFEKMAFDYNKEVKFYDPYAVNETRQLKFVKKLTVNKKHSKSKEYWFTDTHNNLVNLSLESSNPLLSLMDMTVDKNDITIIGAIRKSKRDGLEYLKVDNKFAFV
jgi:hypothetical protein